MSPTQNNLIYTHRSSYNAFRCVGHDAESEKLKRQSIFSQMQCWEISRMNTPCLALFDALGDGRVSTDGWHRRAVYNAVCAVATAASHLGG